MDDFGPALFANFDSANMARYERVYKQAAANNQQQGNATATTTSNSYKNPSNTGMLEDCYLLYLFVFDKTLHSLHRRFVS